MGAFDAAARNKPVIITGWGGQRDFLGDDYPLLVSHSLKPTSDYINDGYFYSGTDVHWAQADSKHAGELMRAVLGDSSSLKEAVRASGEIFVVVAGEGGEEVNEAIEPEVDDGMRGERLRGLARFLCETFYLFWS